LFRRAVAERSGKKRVFFKIAKSETSHEGIPEHKIYQEISGFAEREGRGFCFSFCIDNSRFVRFVMSMGLRVMALVLAMFAQPVMAGITISPYVSIKSTKSVKPVKKSAGQETETVKQRKEGGIRAGVRFFRLLNIQASAGQSVLTTTEKTQAATDEYGQIDFQKDLNMSTDNPDSEVKITETQRNARLSIILDPGFWIFMLRAKVGVTATQRILTVEEVDKPATTSTFGPTYKPHSGVGFGIRFSPKMYAMAEYNMYHYKFPEKEPFEREVAVTYALEL
jgi:hypothetical protein